MAERESYNQSLSIKRKSHDAGHNIKGHATVPGLDHEIRFNKTLRLICRATDRDKTAFSRKSLTADVVADCVDALKEHMAEWPDSYGLEKHAPFSPEEVTIEHARIFESTNIRLIDTDQ